VQIAVAASVAAFGQLRQKVPAAQGCPQMAAYVSHLPAWQATATALIVIGAPKLIATVEPSSVLTLGSAHPQSG
jgi:hypothetical protein